MWQNTFWCLAVSPNLPILVVSVHAQVLLTHASFAQFSPYKFVVQLEASTWAYMYIPIYAAGKLYWSLTHLAPVNTSLSDESDSHDDIEHSEDECKSNLNAFDWHAAIVASLSRVPHVARLWGCAHHQPTCIHVGTYQHHWWGWHWHCTSLLSVLVCQQMIRRCHFACVTVLAGNEYIVHVFVVVVASAMTVAVT